MDYFNYAVALTRTHAYKPCNYICHCQSCGNDQGGSCLAETGDCAEAREQERCPISICPMHKPKEEPHEQHSR